MSSTTTHQHPVYGSVITEARIEDPGDSYVSLTVHAGTGLERVSRLDIPSGLLDEVFSAVKDVTKANLTREDRALPDDDEDEDPPEVATTDPKKKLGGPIIPQWGTSYLMATPTQPEPNFTSCSLRMNSYK